jgi:hypothetical protein
MECLLEDSRGLVYLGRLAERRHIDRTRCGNDCSAGSAKQF